MIKKYDSMNYDSEFNQINFSINKILIRFFLIGPENFMIGMGTEVLIKIMPQA